MARINNKLIIGTLTGVLATATPFVTEFEGDPRRFLEAYRDPIGIPTICAGITRGVKMGDKYTLEQCDAAMSYELLEAVSIVQRCAPVPMNENVLAAFASFTYSVGPGGKGVKDGFCALKKTGQRPTMVKKLIAGDYRGACEGITEWLGPKVNGKPLPGIVRRRYAERDLCLTPPKNDAYEVSNE